MIRYILFGFSSTFIFAIFNARHLVDGPGPSFLEFILSIIFLLIWGFYGSWMGRNSEVTFIYFTTFFWGLGLTISLVGINILGPVIIFCFLYIGPLAGFLYLLDIYGQPLVFLNTALPLIISILGYRIGQEVSQKSDS
ncbi:hypothetical protein JCM14036_22370 [Desulfotomaculum defluvii]